MNIELGKIEKRPVRYWFEDGIYELSFGVLQVVMGVYLWTYTLIPPKSFWHVPWAIAGCPLLLLGARLLNRAIRTVKQKLTYPRTGFVSYRQPEDKRKRRKLILVQSAFFVGAMGIASGIFRSHAFGHPTPIAGLPLAAGIFGAGVEFWIGLKTAVFRFFVIAAISAAAGVALAMSGFTEMAAFGAYWGIMGAVKCSSGAFSLFLYLRRHPASGADPT